MKRFYCFFAIFTLGFYFSQIKVNKRKDIEIYLIDSTVSMKRYLDANKPYKYKIINHTNDNYIIDSQGFRGGTNLYEDNELYDQPEKIISKGYYSRDCKDCKEDFIVLKKKTAAVSIGVGDYSIGFNLFTGLRNQASYDQETIRNGGEKWPIVNEVDSYGRRYKYGFVAEQGPAYRLGAAYFGYKNLRIGVNSEHVRHAIQDVATHYNAGPQGGLETNPGIGTLIFSIKLKIFLQHGN